MLARPSASLSLVARRAPQKLIQARGVHIDNTVYNNMPFNYRNKRTFAAKVAVFFTLGFSIPFIAVKYQLWKAGAGGEAK